MLELLKEARKAIAFYHGEPKPEGSKPAGCQKCQILLRLDKAIAQLEDKKTNKSNDLDEFNQKLFRDTMGLSAPEK